MGAFKSLDEAQTFIKVNGYLYRVFEGNCTKVVVPKGEMPKIHNDWAKYSTGRYLIWYPSIGLHVFGNVFFAIAASLRGGGNGQITVMPRDTH